jgi:hypothetical protein
MATTGLSTIIAAFITGVLGPILLLVAKRFYDKRKPKPDMVVEALELSGRVVTKLEHIKEEFNVDRVWVTQFHNGGHFYPTGKSIAKFSIIYESVGPNTSSVQSNFQNIPVSLFSKSINQLLDSDIICIPDFKDETVATYGLKYVAEESNCKSGYLFAIKTIDDKFIGTLGLDFTKKKTKLSVDDIRHLTNHATAIGGELVTHLGK